MLACLALPLLCLPRRTDSTLLSKSPSRPKSVGHLDLGERIVQPEPFRTTDSRQPGLDSSSAQHKLGQSGARTAFQRQYLLAALVSMLCRTLTAAAATMSAAIQRRHLMVWALFAPKFVFEAVTLLVCDVVLVLAELPM